MPRGSEIARDCLIGIDVGTTAVKAILIDALGNRIAEFTQKIAMTRRSPGYAEQNPAEWMDGVLAALTSFASRHNLSGLAGIGICSQVNTHVFVGSGEEALLPAITWQDNRCAADATTLDAQVSAEQKTTWFGGPMPIDASHALSRMAYVARVCPDVYAKTRYVLLPKDYCVMRLTGTVLSDAIAAVGLAGSGGYINDLLEIVPRADELLPPLQSFHHVAGRVRQGMPCEGTPVVVGAMDAWGGMFGLGVVEDRDTMYQSGTSEILGIVSALVNPTPGVVLFPAYEGIRMHAAPTQSGGGALEWFSGVLGKTPAQLSMLATESKPAATLPLFLPHLQGERAPIWDTASRGVFARMDSQVGGAEMARSVMEGVAFSARWAFQALQSSSGVTISRVNIGGGGARSDTWCQIRADALGFTVQRSAVVDVTAVGAAILAGLGSGIMSTLRDAVRQLVKFDRIFEPQAVHRAYYDEKFGHFLALYEALRPINSRYATFKQDMT